MNPKKIAFEYFVYQLHLWYKEVFGSTDHNDLSTLKVLKLLFFTSAAGTNKYSSETLLDTVFNNFCAMPYGHVESDIYKLIKENKLTNIKLNTSDSSIIEKKLNLDEDVKKSIDYQIYILKKINYNLIKYSSFQLVELSHKYYSWQKNYMQAKTNGIFSIPIPISDIKTEIKIYQL